MSLKSIKFKSEEAIVEKAILEKFVLDRREYHPANGNVVFACDEGEDYASISTWTFDDAVCKTVLASGYRTEFLLSLNEIISHRIATGMTPSDGGEVEFTESGIEIKWLNAQDALELREKVWQEQS